jgi:glutamine amidotransferase
MVLSRIASDYFFGHVRAASPGMPVQDANCHPFFHGRLMFMHNGAVQGFHRLRRRLLQALSDRAFESIAGSTDSEHAFAVLLDELGDAWGELSSERLRAATVATLRRLIDLAGAVGAPPEMYCNFVVTDGQSVVATRFAHGGARAPASLHYSAGERYIIDGDDGDMLRADTESPGAVIVASEPLTRHADAWHEVPPNHSITVDPSLRVRVEPIAI